MEINQLKHKLISYSKNIEELIKFLDNKFQNKILLHFQIHSCEGFEFPIENNFIATNTIPNEIGNIYNISEESILLRFFCNTNTKFFLKNHNELCKQLKLKTNSPIFFVSPYQDSYEEEHSYIIEPTFEIKITITKSALKISFENFLENDNLFDEIKEKSTYLFKNPKKIEQDIRRKIDKKITLSPEISEIIDKAKKHMELGDCYLANITTTQTISSEKKFITIMDFFRSWISIYSRYGIYYKDPEKGIACFSPERFLLLKDGIIATEPIKGTLKSKKCMPILDDANEIWANKKEIYEHTLVVDLMRNDLYQVCKPESIIVYRPFYARISGSLIQMQSFILGKLKKEENLSSCLAKMLPAGSITGTPKKRVCEIISNLETNKRGYYTGVCGILEQNGNFDSTILIRSIYMGQRGIYFGVGAGITTLSDTQLEFEEFEIKLNSFLPVFEGLL
jgi:para-aminobenzoate synthetase component I